MRDRTLLLVTGTLVVLLALERVARARPAGAGTPPPPAVSSTVLAGRTSPTRPPAAAVVPLRDVAGSRDARELILAAGGRTYLGRMFAETDSLLRRWDPAKTEELRVAYVVADLPGWTGAHQNIVREAFAAWEEVGPPIRFTEVFDTAGADIVVRWVQKFDIDRAGQADLSWDHRGRIRHADMKLALLTPSGRVLTGEKLRAIALHEIGHSLGLPHSEVPGDLMFPTADHPVLTTRDTTTYALLYRLLSGSIKWAADSASPPR
jgi:hypothetical protein